MPRSEILYAAIHITLGAFWLAIGTIHDWDRLRTAFWVALMAFIWDKAIYALSRALDGR